MYQYHPPKERLAVMKLSRKALASLPSNSMVVDRRTAYGNPWVVDADGDRRYCVAAYGHWLACEDCAYILPARRAFILAHLPPAGATLGCWCVNWQGKPGRPAECHAMVLYCMANGLPVELPFMDWLHIPNLPRMAQLKSHS